MRGIPWIVLGKTFKSDILTSTLVSCVTVSPLHLRTLSQGPGVSSKTVSACLSCLFEAVSGGRDRIYLRPNDQFLFVCGAMVSSAVSSVLCLRDAAGNHAETRSGACIYYGDEASFHEWEFRTRLRIAGKTGDQYTSKQYPESVTDYVTTHASQHKKLASTIYVKFLMEDLVILTR